MKIPITRALLDWLAISAALIAALCVALSTVGNTAPAHLSTTAAAAIGTTPQNGSADVRSVGQAAHADPAEVRSAGQAAQARSTVVRSAGQAARAAQTESGQTIADIATSYLGQHMGTKNDPNGNPPSWYEWWCADFASYVWGKAGADTSGLNAAAASFEFSYAHESFSATPHVGDVMVVGSTPGSQSWDNVTHVAIVTQVSGGQVTTVGGDEGPGMWYDNSVQQQTNGAAVGSYYGYGFLGGQSVPVYVYGYASPYFPYTPQPTKNLYLRVADGSLSGNYASTRLNAGDVVKAGVSAPGPWERYTFIPVPGKPGAYYIRSQATGAYLSARFNLPGNQRGTLYANVTAPGRGETFYEQHVGSDQAFYVYDNAGSKWYVSTEMNQGGTLRARTTQSGFDQHVNNGSWELFHVGS